MARGIRGVLVECHLYFSESPVCPLPACIGFIIVRSLLLAGAANSESIVPGPRDWLATYVFLPLRRWHYKFPCKPLICFSQSHSLYYLDLLLALLGSNLRGRGCCCVQVVRTWLRSSMIVKTEEDPLKEADIWLRTWLTMWSWRCGTTRSISFLHFFKFKVSSKRSPGSRLLIVNSLSKHLAHPFLLPAAHKIVNCLGKQAMGNLGVEKITGHCYIMFMVRWGQRNTRRPLSIEFIWKEFQEIDMIQRWYVPPIFCSLKVCTWLG